MSFGTGPFGSSPFGTLFFSGSLNILSAVAVNAYSVDVVFDVPLDQLNPNLLDPTKYTFTGTIVCTFVLLTSPTTLRLYTTEQAEGFSYTLTVDVSIDGAGSETFGINTAMFVGASALIKYSVENLVARTHCAGKRIDLFWNNPGTALWNKIVRRQKNWVFDLDDAHNVVYEGAPIESFFDTGIVAPFAQLTVDANAGDTVITVSLSSAYVPGQLLRIDRTVGVPAFEIREVLSVLGPVVTLTAGLENDYIAGETQIGVSFPLQEQRYYYYTVLASDVISPPDFSYDFTDDNRAQALSIDTFDSKNDFFWRNTPAELEFLDSQPTQNGYLDDWYSIMGCWLNLMRGHAKALLLLGDNDEAPFTSMSAKNISLGIDPEGYSYDNEIPRRTAVSLVNVYKVRGTCEGIVRAVSMFTKWDSICAEFSIGGCRQGATTLSTWDGTSTKDVGTGDSGTITIVNRSIDDSSKSFTVDEWKEGFVIGPIGDIACVASNDATEIVLSPIDISHTLSASTLVGATVIPLNNTDGLFPGLSVQVESATTPATAEVVEILSVAPGVSITLTEPTLNAYALGDGLSIEKSLIRAEYLGSGATWATISGTTREMTYPNGLWVENQWKNRSVLASDNTLHTVISNTGNALRVVAGALPANGDFALAHSFTLGGSFATRDPIVRYSVYSNKHSFLFDPMLDIELAGTRYDPYSRLWLGGGSTLLGSWGAGDIGVYITSPVAQTIGRASTVVTATLTLDPTNPAPTVNQWAGYFLNPNQNQTRLFRILSNTTTTITVESDISSLVIAGQAYYVLKPRDATRYLQLVRRLGSPLREFAHQDINVRVLFA